jgi:UDP-N-acetylglucosamine diphosphorylase/glucosamine-1-phosphate N-acetyltransferase
VSIEPFVVLDANDGPILIRRGASIASFTRIVGPCYIGQESHIIGDAIRACSIGDVCKVRGEISGTVMLGHSNKGHTGFVGSSYIGRWVNLGAGTTTSNLKNTYGSVHLWTPSGIRDTRLQFLGSMFGDHVKTGIGTLLTTGCVVGAGSNIFGSEITSKYIPPFSWGSIEPYDRFESSKFIEIAERMMARRHVTLGYRARLLLAAACEDSGAVTK